MFKVVDGVIFCLYEGEILGVVGELGCGKFIFVCVIIGLVKVIDGYVVWLGKELLGMKFDEWCVVCSDIQMIFQDLLVLLNLCMIIGEIIVELLCIYYLKMLCQEVCECVKVMMLKVGLLFNLINCYLYECFGGQCQCIGIVCVFIFELKLIICDELVLVLDVLIQVQVVNLFQQL